MVSRFKKYLPIGKDMKKRMLSVLLTVAMVLGLIQVMPGTVSEVKAAELGEAVVTDFMQVQVDTGSKYDMQLYMNGVYEAAVELAAGTHTVTLIKNGEATALTNSVTVTSSTKVYFRFANNKLENSVNDGIIHSAALVGNFNGIEFVDGSAARYDIASWAPADVNARLEYVGGGIYKRTFLFKELASAVTLEDAGYKVALDVEKDNGWTNSFGEGTNNIALTVPAGKSSLTIFVDSINRVVYDDVRNGSMNIFQNSGSISANSLATTVSLVGTVRADNQWIAGASGYDFTQLNDKIYVFQKTFAEGSYEYKCVFNHEKWYDKSGNITLNVPADNTNVVFIYDASTEKLYDTVNNLKDVAKILGMKASASVILDMDKVNVSDLMQVKIGSNKYDLKLYLNGVYEAPVTLTAGTYTAELLQNGTATGVEKEVVVASDSKVYFRLSKGELLDSVNDTGLIKDTKVAGNFAGLTLKDSTIKVTWDPSTTKAALDYIGGGLYIKTFEFTAPLASDVTIADTGYKIAFGNNWDGSIGGTTSDNIPATIPAGRTSFTVLVDEINHVAYDDANLDEFEVTFNDGKATYNPLTTVISFVGSARCDADANNNWAGGAKGYEFTQISDSLYLYQQTYAKGTYEYKAVYDYAKWYEYEGTQQFSGNKSFTVTEDNTNVVFLYDSTERKLYDTVNNGNDIAITLGMKEAPAEAKVTDNATGTTTFQTLADAGVKVELVYAPKSDPTAATTVTLTETAANSGVYTYTKYFGDAALDIVYYYKVAGSKILDGSATTVNVGGTDYSSYTRAAFTGRLVNVPGTFPGESWVANSNPMTYIGNGQYKYTFTNVPAANYQYKISMGSWNENYGVGGTSGGTDNNYTVTVPDTQDVTIYYSDFSHLSVDSVNYVFADITLSGTGIPTGTKLTDEGFSGIYTSTVAMSAGAYSDLKLTDNNGAQTYEFGTITLAADKNVTFYFDPTTEIFYNNASDVKVDTGKIYYNSKLEAYKAPYGAVATGEKVTFSITTGTDAQSVMLAVKGPEKKTIKLTAGEAVGGKVTWSGSTTFSTIGEYSYYFAVSNGSDIAIYADDDGYYGEGKTTDLSNIKAYGMVVYKSGYETPDWMKNAVVYQIFPDRFFDGDESNNLAQTTARGETDYEYITDWYTLPENPEQETALSKEEYAATGAHAGDGNWSNEIYGGDIKGITEKIEYLKALGVTVIYLNPVFSSISSHRYDTTDYTKIDPVLGTLGDFEELVDIAEKNDMHVVLDGVFNHVSDDSIYFDRYYKFLEAGTDTIGAYPYWAYVYDYMKEKSVDQAAAETAAKAYFTKNYGIKDYSYTEWFEVYNSVLLDDNEAEVKDNIGLRAGKAVYGYQGWWGYDSMPVVKSTNGSEFQTGNWADEIIYNDDETSVTQYWLTEGSDGWRLDVANEVSDETWQEFRKSVKALDSDNVIIGEIWEDATEYLLGDMYDSVMNYMFRTAVTAFAKGGSSADAMNTLEKLRERYPEEAFYAMMNLVGSHDTTRILSYLDGIDDDRNQKDVDSAFPTYEKTSDLAKARQYLVAFMQFTYAGAPTIYYGDEIGMVGADDPDDRRAFEWGKGNEELVTWYATLAAIRSQYTALRTGTVEPFTTNDSVMSYVRRDDSNAVIVLANNAQEDKEVTIKLADINISASKLTDLISGKEVTISDGKITVNVPKLSGMIITENAKNITVNKTALSSAYDSSFVIAERDPEYKEDEIKPDVTIPASDGWDTVVDTIIAAPTEAVIEVTMDNTTTVSKDVINAIKGTDKTVVLDMGNGIKWIIKGQDVTGTDIKDIDMKVTVGSGNIPASIIKKLKTNGTVMQISLAASGEFGFKATLSINVGKDYAGKMGNLFYYNAKSGEFEKIDSAKIAADGTILLTMTHASDYVLVIDTQELADLPLGDIRNYMLYLMMLMAAAGAFGTMALKKRKHE